MIKIDPPRVAGTDAHDQIRQVVQYLRRLSEQLNVELNMELEALAQRKEE